MNALNSIVNPDQTLLDELTDEVAGPGLVSSLGLLSALLLSHEQMAQEVATLSPVQLALSALDLGVLELEPALTSLTQAQPVDLPTSAGDLLAPMSWTQLLSEAQSLVEDVSSVAAGQGLSLDVLGLQSLQDLGADLGAMQEPLISVIGPVDGDVSASLLGLVPELVSDSHEVASAPDASGPDHGLLFGSGDGETGGGVLESGQPDHIGDVLGAVDEVSTDVTGGLPQDTGGNLSTLESPVAPGAEVVSGLSPVVDTLPEVIAPLVDALETVVADVGETVGDVADTVEQVTDLLVDVVTDLLTNPADLPQDLVNGVSNVLDSTGDVLTSVVDLAVDTLTGLTGGLTDTVANLVDVLSGDTGLLSPATNVVDTLLGDVTQTASNTTGTPTPTTTTENLVDSLSVATDAGSALIETTQLTLDSATTAVVDVVDSTTTTVPVVDEVVSTVLPIVQQDQSDQGGPLGGLLG